MEKGLARMTVKEIGWKTGMQHGIWHFCTGGKRRETVHECTYDSSNTGGAVRKHKN